MIKDGVFSVPLWNRMRANVPVTPAKTQNSSVHNSIQYILIWPTGKLTQIFPGSWCDSRGKSASDSCLSMLQLTVLCGTSRVHVSWWNNRCEALSTDLTLIIVLNLSVTCAFVTIASGSWHSSRTLLKKSATKLLRQQYSFQAKQRLCLLFTIQYSKLLNLMSVWRNAVWSK